MAKNGTRAKRGSVKKAPVRLEPEAVVRTALALLDDVGLDGLTVRRLAEELGVQNPALYWHFKNKQELLDRMALTMISDAFAGFEEPADRSWSVSLVAIARAFRRAMLSHRDGARVIASANLVMADFFEGLDRTLRLLLDSGFRGIDAFGGILAVFDYALGATFEEQADPMHSPPPGVSPVGPNAFRERVDDARYPTLAAVLDELISAGEVPGPGGRFERGLILLVEGMRSKLPPGRR